MPDEPIVSNPIHTVISPVLLPRGEDSLLEETLIDIYESIINDNDQINDNDEIRYLRNERLLHKSLHWARRPSLMMIICVYFTFAFSLLFSILPMVDLILQLLCRSQNTGSCDKLLAQITLSELQKYTAVLGGMISMVISSKMGQMSDIYGRKPILLFNLTIHLISKIVQWLLLRDSITVFHRSLFILSACLENVSSLPMIMNSYIIDVVDEDQRIVSLGLLSAAISIGLSISPIVSSQILKYVVSSPHTALTISIFIVIGLLLFIILILPESRSERSRKKSRDDSMSQSTERSAILLELRGSQRWSHQAITTLKSFITPLKLLWLPVVQEDGSVNYIKRITLMLLVSCDFLWALTTRLAGSVVILYGTYVFDWGSIEMSYFISISSGSALIALLLISPIILNFFKSFFKINSKQVDNVDLSTIKLLIFFALITVILRISSVTSRMFLFAGIIDGFTSLFSPAMRSAVVKYAPPQSTGAMMGAVSTLDNFADLIGPYIFLSVYQATVKTEPRVFLYLVCGIIVLCSIFIFTIPVKSNDLEDD